jgi:uncharacterized protein YbcI
LASQTSLHSLHTQPSASNGSLARSRKGADLAERRLGADYSPLGSAPLPSDESAERRPVGEAAGEITTRLIGLVRKQTGRGPTKAKAAVSSDLVLVTLADCLTTTETQVVAAGHGELAVSTRRVLYDGIRAEATAIVEELTQREVTAYLTAQHDEPDLAILVFYLGPEPLTLASDHANRAIATVEEPRPQGTGIDAAAGT